MRTKGLFSVLAFVAIALFSYNSAAAQEPEKPKSDTTASNPRVVITDTIADAAKAKEAAAAKPAPTTTQSFGNHAVTVSEGVVGEPQKGSGKWHTVTTWDGTKWVSKREFFPDKKP
ncbi:MAG TPA: hypothetical protein VJL58_06280 [Pyrinomonadaceae bacterium]|nr:hypothetical protein [Pyrinomonadaceae bacterium]